MFSSGNFFHRLFDVSNQLFILLQNGIHMNSTEEKWMIGIMVSVTIIKFLLMLYCRGFQNEIVRAYAQDHFFDVVTNSIGLATAVLAVKFYWWIDPSGAILVSFLSNLFNFTH